VRASIALAGPKSLNYLSGDKFGFGIFVAAAAHAVIVFGLTFEWSGALEPAPEIDVTIVSHVANNAPDDADFIAQANQEASGTEDTSVVPTTDQVSVFVGSDSGQFSPYEAVAGTPDPRTQNSMIGDVSDLSTAEPQQTGDAASDAELSMDATALLARLDVLKQELAKRPRIGTLTSVAAKAREDAAYQVMLQERIVTTGNRNYPEQAVEQGIFGSLRLQLTLLPDGRIESAEILQSSGEVLLDQAAVEIARKAGPFDPFPPELSAKYDKIVFIRTWQFLPGGRLSSM